MSVDALLGARGTLRRNVTISLIVALIIAFLIGLLRTFSGEIRQIPGMAPVMDFIAPGFQAPNVTVGGLTIPERSPFQLPTNNPPELNINRGSSGGCCNSCDGSGRGDLIQDVTQWLANATRNAAPAPTFQPAPAPCFPRTDWRAFAQHPSNRDLMRAYNNLTSQDWQWVSSHGYPASLSGYAQYMAEVDPSFSSSVRRGARPQPRGFTTC